MHFSHKKINISNFKFGVELEIGINIEDFIHTCKVVNGWMFHEEHCGTEIVSPPLAGYSGLMSVRNQLRQLHSDLCAGGFDEVKLDDCGLHVHVDIQHYSMGNAKRLIRLARRFDDVLFAIMCGDRYNNHYTHHIKCAEEDIDNCVTIADLQRLQVDGRYSCVNMYAFPKHGTVEFRYAGATLDWRKMYSLISLYLRMVYFAGSTEPIPNRMSRAIRTHKANFIKSDFSYVDEGKELLFNSLQVGGMTRKILIKMFEDNKDSKNKTKMFEFINKKVWPAGLRDK